MSVPSLRSSTYSTISFTFLLAKSYLFLQVSVYIIYLPKKPHMSSQTKLGVYYHSLSFP